MMDRLSARMVCLGGVATGRVGFGSAAVFLSAQELRTLSRWLCLVADGLGPPSDQVRPGSVVVRGVGALGVEVEVAGRRTTLGRAAALRYALRLLRVAGEVETGRAARAAVADMEARAASRGSLRGAGAGLDGDVAQAGQKGSGGGAEEGENVAGRDGRGGCDDGSRESE